MLTDRENKLFLEIKDWEQSLYSYEPNDLVLTYEKYLERAFALLPEQTQEEFLSVLDTWLFHLHALIQGSSLQHDAKERILAAGRVFNEDISQLDDLKNLSIDQLQYIAKQQIARHRLYSFAQGGLSGTGGPLVLGADIPAIIVINLRVVQLIAMTYGYEVNNPFEMMTSLKVFHAATLPKRLLGQGWEQLMDELHATDEFYFYDGEDKLTDTSWLEQPLKQIIKGWTILLFKNRKIQGIPVVSMALGAGMNYQLTRKVTEFAHNYYQMRYLLEKEQ
ncbi:EcsC family protein [Robertmurraya yapensis]|uniref:EcsC family protein n=1 Tax=Bacillus yapensis TaxID=2492960 RepID=A0A431W2F3_9BACI|nr:EcsC family protein [Bacillus yapensis]RTR29605.1 EcsC family protein [Bacillus yapensis]TKS94951.1 EcsC family protein [Bacillus yapensis]